MTGRRIVGMIQENLRVRDIVTREALENCITVLMASGGSTNLLIHLTAIARRAGIELPLNLFREISDRTPLLVNTKPVGDYTVGIEFQQSGGVPALMKELEGMLHTDALTVTGRTVGENLAKVEHSCNPKVIAPIDRPLSPNGGIATLFGNLAPRGAVIKRAADSPELLRGYGPKGAPGMPEFGNYMPIPPKLYRRGVKDYLRITDARMSGGAFGTVVLHVCPEAAAGGPLGALRDGDIITMDVDAGTLNVELSDEEIARRLAETKFEPKEKFERGFIKHYTEAVLQADEGCDFSYLQ